MSNLSQHCKQSISECFSRLTKCFADQVDSTIVLEIPDITPKCICYKFLLTSIVDIERSFHRSAERY